MKFIDRDKIRFYHDEGVRQRMNNKKNIFTLLSQYKDYHVDAINYGTVRDYCDSMDNLKWLTDIHKDLKDVQRPWILKAILSQVPVGAKLIEIGAGEPLIANILSQIGYKVYVVDPYDGSGNGPKEYEYFKSQYPSVRFIRKYFTEDMDEFREGEIDCVYSVSVLEHIPDETLRSVFRAIKRLLNRYGCTIHAVDHILKGNGAEASLNKLKLISEEMDLYEKDLTNILQYSSEDTETFFLSAYGHNLWRGVLPYSEFPMRICISLHLYKKMSRETDLE